MIYMTAVYMLNENSLKSDPFSKKQNFQKYSTNTAAQSVRTYIQPVHIRRGLVHMYYIHEMTELLGFQTMLILNIQFMVFDAVIVFDAE